MIYTIEDLLEVLDNCIKKQHSFVFGVLPDNNSILEVRNPADIKFVSDLSQKTRQEKNFSTKQAFIAIKIIQKHAAIVAKDLGIPEEQILAICDNPVYRKEPYKSTNVPKEVRYLGNRKLVFRSKYAPQIVDRFKQLKSSVGLVGRSYPYFNKTYNVWIVEITESVLDKVMNIIKKFGFQFNDEVLEFLTKCENAKEERSTATVADDNIILEVKNNELLSAWVEQILLEEKEDV